MDSSDNDEAQETPTSPSDAPQAEPQIDLADEEGFPAPMFAEVSSEAEEPVLEPAPPPMAEPGIYWCDHESPGEHAVLGRIKPGENDYSDITDVRQLEAIAACVKTGLLEKM